MPLREWRRSYPFKGNRVDLEVKQLSYQNSPRGADGKLRLRTNPMTSYHSQLVNYQAEGDYYEQGYIGSADSKHLWKFSSLADRAHQIAYGRLRGKLYKGNAALGVTFAQLRQSRDMIEARSNLIASSAEHLSSLASRKKVTRKLANSYLETIFGWQPLFADIHASCMTVIQKADSVEYVRASGTVNLDVTERGRWDSEVQAQSHYSGFMRVSIGGQVVIANPNKWLLERAGLINPLAVAWDMVPFSFLVNMISNTGSLVNQISDFYGLTFREAFTNYKQPLMISRQTRLVNGKGSIRSLVRNVESQRYYGLYAPDIKLSFRMPEFSWSTAAMAASLAVQQSTKAIRIVSRVLAGTKYRHTYTE